jgi:hypothetical protein
LALQALAVSLNSFEVFHVHNAWTPDGGFRSFTLVVTAAVDPIRGAAVGAIL